MCVVDRVYTHTYTDTQSYFHEETEELVHNHVNHLTDQVTVSVMQNICRTPKDLEATDQVFETHVLEEVIDDTDREYENLANFSYYW